MGYRYTYEPRLLNMNAVKLINIGNLVTYSSIDNSVVSLEDMEIVISDGKIIDVGRQLNDCLLYTSDAADE